MSEQSTAGVQQRRIQIKLNEDGRPEFWVRLEVGDWTSDRVVGEWYTHESEWGHESVVTFAFPDERGMIPDVEVDEGELDAVRFEVEHYQDEGCAPGQQAPAAKGGDQ